ncbi:MAG TPA: S1 RNA-binding domain-containing protein, partial [Spirochaetota bacterium]|nr:S1 RNA-binding domain-containing protein [Spirochaetota bacterium]
TAGDKYHPGDTVSGKIVTITNFGLFVEVGDGIEGLVNSSDISWTKKNVNPADIFHKGEAVETKVLSIDAGERKMSLGIKQLQENPWDTIEKRFPPGMVLTKPVKNVVNFGLFVELEEDVDGLIHVSDVSWEDDQRDIMKQYSAGDQVEFKILEIKKDQMKVACGIKQLTRSPWEAIYEKYPPRSRVTGVISKITNFGLFVKIEDGIEGLVHISEVSRKKVDDIEDYFKVGENVHAVVLGVDVDKKRMSLSIKHYDMIMEKEELNRVLHDAAPGKVTLGDIFKDKLQ